MSPRSIRLLAAGLGVALCAVVARSGGDCSRTSVGLVPLNDLVAGDHHGEPGGLYPGGSNHRPARHEADGVAIAQAIGPLDASGAPDAGGIVGLISIGMSNATQEWSRFMQLVAEDDDLHPNLQIVDGAQGGVDARRMADPGDRYWTQTIPARLQAAQVDPAQVQVAWLKQAVARPEAAFPVHAQELSALMEDILNILQGTFPNLRICFLNSRTYAGYANTTLNPEPFAYEQGFAVRWVIERQLAGSPGLNYDPDAGEVRAPWLSWGSYVWADGLEPRSDGLTWECDDFGNDGTHPSDAGRSKVAKQLRHHFRSDRTSTPWFLAAGQAPCDVPSFVERYGTGTQGEIGEPQIGVNQLPTVPTDGAFQVRAWNARPLSLAAFLLGLDELDGSILLWGGPLWVAPDMFFFRTTNAAGRANLPFGSIPQDPALCGLEVVWQVAVQDPAGPTGRGSVTKGLRTRLGD